jgi:protein SCO1
MSVRAFVTTAVLGAALAGGALGQTSASSLPPAAAGVSFEQRLGAVVPVDEALRGEDGKPVTLREVAGGKPLVLVLVWYRCPMLCGEITKGVLRSLRGVSLEAGTDFRVAFVSIDPGEGPDLAAKKKQNVCAEYARPGCEHGLRFLTGTAAATEAIAQSVGYRYHWDETTAAWVHAAGIVVLTPAGVVSRYLFGVEYPPRDLRLAILDSAAERIGSLADQLLLLCYHYDPTTGRYGFAIQSALRIGAIATVAALVIGIWRASRRPRPRVTEG